MLVLIIIVDIIKLKVYLQKKQSRIKLQEFITQSKKSKNMIIYIYRNFEIVCNQSPNIFGNVIDKHTYISFVSDNQCIRDLAVVVLVLSTKT